MLRKPLYLSKIGVCRLARIYKLKYVAEWLLQYSDLKCIQEPSDFTLDEERESVNNTSKDSETEGLFAWAQDMRQFSGSYKT